MWESPVQMIVSPAPGHIAAPASWSTRARLAVLWADQGKESLERIRAGLTARRLPHKTGKAGGRAAVPCGQPHIVVLGLKRSSGRYSTFQP